MFWPLNSHSSRLFSDAETKIVTKCFDGQLITMRTEGFRNQTKIFFLYLPDAGKVREIFQFPTQEWTLCLHLKNKNNCFRNDWTQGTVFEKQKMFPRQGEEKKNYWEKIKRRGKKSFNRVETVSLSVCPWKVLIQPYLLS